MQSKIGAAAEALLEGRAVAYPTETFYALGACLLVPGAAENIFRVKGRSEAKPLPAIVSCAADARRLWREIPEDAEKLMAAFWPGPLTIVLPASSIVPHCAAPFGEIGVRVSPHPAAQRLAALAGPLVSTSANISGRGEATEASALDPLLLSRGALVLDAGRTPGGLPSTLVRLTGGSAQILRAGAIEASRIEAVLGRAVAR